jgi:hypothetical protein
VGAGGGRDREVIILSLGSADASCAHSGAAAPLRVPVLACRDVLTAGGATVDPVTATSDDEIDAVLARLDGPARPDGLTWPAGAGHASAGRDSAGRDSAPALIVAVDSDAQLRAVLRRMVRRWAPPPSRRPADLVAGRTVPDLPPIGLLALDVRGPAAGRVPDLVDRLRLPRDPAEVAKAVLGGDVRRIDLLRTDGGSVTVHGALLGGVDASGRAAAWRGRVELDDTVLADGKEPVLACAVANADGYARLDDLPLAPAADPCSGTVAVAVAVPVRAGSRFSFRPGAADIRIEVRRATGRAVSVTPAADLPYVDDGVQATLTRKRAWWVEPGAWAVYGR